MCSMVDQVTLIFLLAMLHWVRYSRILCVIRTRFLCSVRKKPARSLSAHLRITRCTTFPSQLCLAVTPCRLADHQLLRIENPSSNSSSTSSTLTEPTIGMTIHFPVSHTGYVSPHFIDLLLQPSMWASLSELFPDVAHLHTEKVCPCITRKCKHRQEKNVPRLPRQIIRACQNTHGPFQTTSLEITIRNHGCQFQRRVEMFDDTAK